MQPSLHPRRVLFCDWSTVLGCSQMSVPRAAHFPPPWTQHRVSCAQRAAPAFQFWPPNAQRHLPKHTKTHPVSAVALQQSRTQVIWMTSSVRGCGLRLHWPDLLPATSWPWSPYAKAILIPSLLSASSESGVLPLAFFCLLYILQTQ